MAANSFKDFEVLPIEIFACNILPRLPVKTLLRLKCLSKFYYEYISSREFIDLHLRHSVYSNCFLVVFSAVRDNRQCLYLLDVDSPGSQAPYLRLPEPFCDKNRHLKIVGSCNGLLCINSFDPVKTSKLYHVMILNPSTGKVFANLSMPTELSDQICSGFGYDHSHDDYKLVVIDYYRKPHFSIHSHRYRKVTVCSMKSSSLRCIEDACFDDLQTVVPVTCSTCVLLGYHLMHWLLTLPAGERSVVCFNFVNERWDADVVLPSIVDFERGFQCPIVLGVLNDCLCLTVFNCADKLDVWIMMEYKAPESWTRISVAFPNHCNYAPIPACEHARVEEICLNKIRPNELEIHTYVWCNLRDETAKKIQFSGAPLPYTLRAHLCRRSLATCFGDFDSWIWKETQVRMEIDYQVKMLRQDEVPIYLT